MNESIRTKNVMINVDVQHDFVDGTLAVAEGGEIIPALNHFNKAARESDGIVIFTRDDHPQTTPHFDTWPVHCVHGTQGAELMSELEVVDGDFILNKGQGQRDGYSGIEAYDSQGNTIESLINEEKKDHTVRVFIGGLATDYCVKATAIDTAERYKNEVNVHLYLLREAVRAVNLQIGDEVRALQAIQDAGVLAVSTQEALEMIEGTK